MVKTHLNALIVHELVVDVIWESLEDEEGVIGGDVEGKDVYLLAVNSLLGKLTCNIALK